MNNFSSLIENSKRAVRYWWLLLIIGIALFVVGILIFVYPTQSYLGTVSYTHLTLPTT